MKPIILASLLIIGGFFQSAIAADLTSPIGTWTTIDDDTGNAKSVVKLWVEGNELKGQIIELLDPTKKGDLCVECSGANKDQPIEGMVFVWGLTAKGEGWDGGNILDPKNGKVYKAKLKLINDGANLEVRGFIGFALLGRTQVWNRMD